METSSIPWLYIIMGVAVIAGIVGAIIAIRRKPSLPGDPPSEEETFYNINTYVFNGAGDTSLLAAADPPVNKGTGIALSGGGSRALSCALGQLRGLQALGVLSQVKFISAVSGGAWASSLYTFLPGSITDDDFLGTAVLNPGDLTWDDYGNIATALDRFTTNNMGHVPTRVGITEFLEKAIALTAEGVPEDELWIRAVGELIFTPYGLYDKHNPKYFSYSERWVKEMIQRYNPSLTPDRFYLPRPGRPYLIVNFNIIPQYGKYPLIPMESTPMVTGVLHQYPNAGQDNRDIGGGYIDSFGFDSSYHEAINDTRVKVDVPPSVYSVHTMAGLSSAAFAEELQTKHLPPVIKDIIPRKNYWPVMNLNTSSYNYHYADGGNLENTGVVGLLRRGLTNIIAFLNDATKLEMDLDNNEVIVAPELPPLFGYQPKTKKDGKWLPYEKFTAPLQDSSYAVMQHLKVFNYDDFWPMVNGLWGGFESNGTAMYLQEGLEVVDQPQMGVKGYTTNKILWMYNNKVNEWHDALNTEVKAGMDLDPIAYADFPHYNTVTQLHLSTRQVNLLAHLSCWNVISESTNGHPGVTNRQIVEGMF